MLPAGSPCPACSNPSCWTKFLDVLTCPVIAGSRIIEATSATDLTNPALTRAQGTLYISANNALTNVDFASLSYVGGFFAIRDNNALTFVSVPSLSQLQKEIFICNNHGDFLVPPALGSVEFGGQDKCYVENGSGACGTFVTCPYVPVEE